MAITAEMRTQVLELYTAYFNRAADKAGVDYWTNEMDTNGWTLDQVAQSFADQTEYTTAYAGMDNAAIVTAVYTNVLNRDADTDGSAYWVSELDAGTMSVENLIQAVVTAAKEDKDGLGDADVLANKVAVSEYAYAENLNEAAAKAVSLTAITADATTVETVKAEVVTAKADYTPVTASLTTGDDTVTGSKADDTFTADILTVGSKDSIVDSSTTDNDTLNMTINTTVAATTVVTNVENINVTSLGANTINMDKMTGVSSLSTNASTGKITVAAAQNNMDLAFSGSTTNSIDATFTSDALSGTADKLTLNLNAATGVTAKVNAGFESAEVVVDGASTLTSVTAPGVTSTTISGNGTLTIGVNALVGMTDVKITDTSAIKLGANTTAFKSFVATDNTGGITGVTALASNSIYSADNITGDATGLSVLLGSGNDNMKITEAANSSSSNTIKLGAGNDILDLYNNATVGATYVFGEDGDDTIRVNTAALASTDYVNGGAGTDTLDMNVSGSTLTLTDVENLTLEGANTTIVSSSNVALAVDHKIAANGNAVSITGLSAGSTFSSSLATGVASTAQNGTVNVAFAATEASTNLNMATGMSGALGTTKITDVTVTLGAASTLADVTVTDATSLTINATGALSGTGTNDITTAGNTLTDLTITGTKAVTIDDVLPTSVKNVTVTADGAISIGKVAASDALETISYTATAATGSVTADDIGSNSVTELKSVDVTAAQAATIGTIDAKIIGDINATASNGLLTVGAITSVGALGTVNLTSTKGAVKAANTAVTAADDTGITVNATAATAIHGTTNATTAAVVENTAGDITSTLSGETTAASYVNYTITDSAATGVGSVNLTATGLKGGLTTTIANDEAKATGTSTISLGAKDATTVNQVTLDGYTGKVTVNGSAGKDTIIDQADGNLADTSTVVVNSSDIFTGSAGDDTISYAGHAFTDTDTLATNEATANGMAVNLSSSTVTFYTGTSTDSADKNKDAGMSTLASGKAAQYDSGATGADADEKAILAGGETDTLSGFETVIGTAVNDYLIASSTGTTLDAGSDGADYLIGGAGNDTMVMGAKLTTADHIDGKGGSDELTFTDGDSTTTDLDHVTNVETITIGAAVTSVATVDALVASGKTLTVDGSSIGANNFTFDGSNETDGKFIITGAVAAANDVWTGGAGDDIFNIDSANIDASDSINGTSGTDVVYVTGNTAVVNADIDAASFENIDKVVFQNTSTAITWTIATGETDNAFEIDASATSGIVTIDGSSADDHALTITTGAGNDIITGDGGVDHINTGAGNDSITAGAGIDIVTTGIGADTIIFANSDSILTGGAGTTGFDTITDYETGVDKIDDGGTITLAANTDATGEATVSSAGLVTAYNGAATTYDTFAEKVDQIDKALGGTAHQAALFTDNNKTYLYISVSTDATNDGADTIVELTGVTADTGITLTSGDITAIA